MTKKNPLTTKSTKSKKVKEEMIVSDNVNTDFVNKNEKRQTELVKAKQAFSQLILDKNTKIDELEAQLQDSNKIRAMVLNEVESLADQLDDFKRSFVWQVRFKWLFLMCFITSTLLWLVFNN